VKKVTPEAPKLTVPLSSTTARPMTSILGSVAR
jgi:hypothetical protein